MDRSSNRIGGAHQSGLGEGAVGEHGNQDEGNRQPGGVDEKERSESGELIESEQGRDEAAVLAASLGMVERHGSNKVEAHGRTDQGEEDEQQKRQGPVGDK